MFDRFVFVRVQKKEKMVVEKDTIPLNTLYVSRMLVLFIFLQTKNMLHEDEFIK